MISSVVVSHDSQTLSGVIHVPFTHVVTEHLKLWLAQFSPPGTLPTSSGTRVLTCITRVTLEKKTYVGKHTGFLQNRRVY